MIDIKDSEVEDSINYLRVSIDEYAKWKSRMKFLEKYHKSVLAAESLKGHGKISENKLRAEASVPYKEILEEYEQSVLEFTVIDARRAAAETRIELYRTMSASLRRGNI